MSYFVFGQIRYSDDFAEGALVKSAWHVVKCGYDVGLYMSLGYNIIQRDVREMVPETCGVGGVRIPFLLLSTPLENTSENLVSPFDLSPEDILRNLHLVERWVSGVRNDVGVQGITLILTEGYDDQFEKVSVQTEDMPSLIASKIDEAGEVPSLIVEVL
jgi:hypothetical protein